VTTTPDQQATEQPDIDVRAAAIAAAHDVFGIHLKLTAPPRCVVEEALDAATAVYETAYQAEVDRLVAETGWAGMEVVDGDVRLRLKYARDFAHAVVTNFDATIGATNYTETEFTVTDSSTDIPRKYTFLVIKPGGKTPHRLRQEADAERDRALARIDAAHDALTRIYGGDTDDFATLETTVEYVVDRFQAIAVAEADAANEVARLRQYLRAIYEAATGHQVPLDAGDVRVQVPGADFDGWLRVTLDDRLDAVTEMAERSLGIKENAPARPKVVVLCGSTRFYDEFQAANYRLTMDGVIVLSVGFYPHASAEHGHGEGVGHDSDEKLALDELHKRKIDLADEVLVVSDERGYFGESTRSEIAYATALGKPVEFVHPSARERWDGLA